VQITFSMLIVLQTPAQGWLVDRFGPRTLVAIGAALTGLGWVLSAHVDNVWLLFLTYRLFCGVGVGIVYVGVVGLMATWFPDRPGFAIGIVAAGYGMGAPPRESWRRRRRAEGKPPGSFFQAKGKKTKGTGGKFKANGSKIQVFSFHELKRFKGLNAERTILSSVARRTAHRSAGTQEYAGSAHRFRPEVNPRSDDNSHVSTRF
jgi:hypothetical protein